MSNIDISPATATLLVGLAAERAGAHPETLRRAIRAGKAQATRDEQRLLHVDITSLDAWSEARVEPTTRFESLQDAARRIAAATPRQVQGCRSPATWRFVGSTMFDNFSCDQHKHELAYQLLSSKFIRVEEYWQPGTRGGFRNG